MKEIMFILNETLPLPLRQGLLVSLVAIFVTCRLGFSGYKKQKMRDELSRLYFEDGIESLISHLVKNLNIIEKNFTSALYITRNFKNLSNNEYMRLFQWKFKNSFISINPSIGKFFYRTVKLLNSRELEELLLYSFARFQITNEFFITEVPITIEKFMDKSLNGSVTKEDLIKELNNEIQKRKDEIKYLYMLIQYLEEISLQIKNLDLHSYSHLQKIKKDKQIKKILCDIAKLGNLNKEDSKNKK